MSNYLQSIRVFYTFLLFIVLAIIQKTSAQAPFNIPDNVGAGNCLQFTTVDAVTTPTNADGFSEITVECWANVSSVSMDRSIIGNWDGGPQNERYFLIYADNASTDSWRAIIANSNSSSYSSPANHAASAVVLNQWTHLAMTFKQNDEFNFYVDGKLITTRTTANFPMNTSTGLIRFGDGGDGTRNFEGQIDEVRIWSRELTQNEIKNNMCKQLEGNETGLLGYWSMNEGTGTTVVDLTGNGNNGTLQ